MKIAICQEDYRDGGVRLILGRVSLLSLSDGLAILSGVSCDAIDQLSMAGVGVEVIREEIPDPPSEITINL